MNETTKKNIIIISLIVVLCAAISGLTFWGYREQCAYDAKLAELSDANSRLREQLAKADYQLDELINRYERADEIVRSSGTILGELRESVESNVTTIREIREQQQRIRATVIQLIEDYNELTRELDGNSDGE